MGSVLPCQGSVSGVFGMLAGVLIQKRYAVIAIPALWVGIERIPGPFFYTWLTLGNAGIDMALPMRLAPFTGVYGLSFVFALFGTSVAWIALRRPRKPLVWLALLLILALLPSLPNPTQPTRTAVTVQPNIEERDNWTPQEAQIYTNALSCCRSNPASRRPDRTSSLARNASAVYLLRGSLASRTSAIIWRAMSALLHRRHGRPDGKGQEF